MKLGIITFYCSHNYGAMLQTYGLQEYLKKQGNEVFVIDFKPDYDLKLYKKNDFRAWLSRNPMKCFKRLANYIRYKHIRHKRWDGFHSFMNCRLSLFPYKKGDDFHDFDAIFIGSDQVWSPYHTGGWYDDIMFGKGFKCKAISYAASCTSTILDERQKDYLRNHLSGMDAISVRENQFKKALQPLTRHTISVVLDPTFLAGSKVFNAIATPINKERPFVLIYEITQHKEVYDIACGIANQLNADIVELTNGMLNYHRSTMDEGASPEEFLGYFKNAACVVTTSFHGTAFSLIFQKSFYMVKMGSSADDRMTSLLYTLNLQDRIISKGDMPIFTSPNYNKSKERLHEMVSFSESFIANSLVL